MQRFVFSSTAAVYGTPDESPIPEDAPLRPINPYGETKRTLETALEWYGRAHGLRSVTLRYFNVAGATDDARRGPRPRDPPHPERPRGRRGRSALTVFGDDYPTPDGTCVRDYIHVADLADAHLLALEATAPGDRRTDSALVCNLGNGGGFSVREVLDATARLVGHEVPHTVGPATRGRPARPRRAARSGQASPPLAAEATVARRDHRLGAGMAPAHPRGYRA